MYSLIADEKGETVAITSSLQALKCDWYPLVLRVMGLKLSDGMEIMALI